MLNNVDADPIVILGCTQKEIIMLIMIGAGIGFIPSLLMGLLLGGFILTLPNLVLWTLAWMTVSTRWLSSVKQGKPEGWYLLQAHVISARFFGSPLLLRHGRWEIGK